MGHKTNKVDEMIKVMMTTGRVTHTTNTYEFGFALKLRRPGDDFLFVL